MEVIKRLYLGIVILTLCSAILLISDWHSRQVVKKLPDRKSIALLKFSSNLLLDEAEEGYIKRLAQHGYRDGENIIIKRFCPEGDTAAHNIIAKQITDGSFDLVSSISTLSLQAVANANKNGKAIHIFNTVTDPAGAGGGIKSLNSLNKPPYMTGIGTFQPV
ncbi:MAG: hypothetical protein IT292_08290 [Deltaproteobacteria bacterium]|nr:hypothetical protein [Deltaproteobacteria bacterium]